MKPIFLTGYMGSGKTTIGKTLADTLQYQFIDLDDYIEKKYARKIAEIFALEGEIAFREIERDCLHEIARNKNAVISTGGGAPCFFENMEFMNTSGITVYLKLGAELLVKRLCGKNRKKRPLIAGKSNKELEKHVMDQLKIREPYYNKASIIIENYDAVITLAELEKILKIKYKNETLQKNGNRKMD